MNTKVSGKLLDCIHPGIGSLPYYLCVGSDLVNHSAVINTCLRDYLLCSSMSNNFFLGCIGLNPRISVPICHCPCVESGFVVVAFGEETKLAMKFADIVVFGLEVHTVFHVTKVRK